MGYDSLSNWFTSSPVQKKHPESSLKDGKNSIHQQVHASSKNLQETMPSDEVAKKLIEINTHLLPSSLSVKQNGDIIGNRTKKKYGNIDIASFRILPIESNFVYTRNSWEDEWYPIHAVYETNSDGESVYKEWKNVYFSDKNRSYVYLGNSNIVNQFENSNGNLEKFTLPELISRRKDYQEDAYGKYFISNGNLYEGVGWEQSYPFPDGKKWNKSVKVHGDFSLIETSDGSLYTRDNEDRLAKLSYKISDIIIQKKSWKMLEDPKNWVHISIKVKRTWEIIQLNPYF